MNPRHSTWALPPHPPEAWLGGRRSLGLSTALAVAAILPVTQLLQHLGLASTATAGLQLAAGFAALVAAYLLLVQSAVTTDPVLRFVAGGCAAAFLLVQLSALRAGGTPSSAGLWLVSLLALPVFALAAPLGRRHHQLALVPAAVLFALLVALLAAPVAQLANGSPTTPAFRRAMTGAALIGAGAALSWARTGSYGRRGSWAWVTAALTVGPLSALLALGARRAGDAMWWAGQVAAPLPVLVLALGLGLHTSKGFFRQAHSWRVLEQEVRLLRATSTLLPGRAVTPEDEEGLPEEPQVRELISSGTVRVALQAVVELQSGAVVGYEALARMGSRTPTDRWFRAASRCGLAEALERVTLGAALEQVDRVEPGAFLAINLSPAALSDGVVMSLLRRAPLARLVVEVTEHEAVADYPEARAVLDELRSRGARVAVDDTGAGFASLQHVLLLQPDLIKLDISLTRDVCTDRRAFALVAALTAFADEVGAIVLAEGVETQEQVDVLTAIGVQMGQGWHLGLPVLM